jgi:glycerol kinase
VQSSVGAFGRVEGRGWPLTAVFGDQQAALFGQGCRVPGEAKCTYGTGAFVLCHCGSTPPQPAHGLLATVAWRLGDVTEYALEGSVMVCGAAMQWLRDGLGILPNVADAEVLARSVADSGGVVFVPAFAGLGTPDWDPHARGLLIGLTRGTTRAHIVRAAIEAMALQVDEVLAAMAASRGGRLRELRVDGGAAANGMLLELQAALAGMPVRRPAFRESTAFGAGLGAMLGSGAVRKASDLPSPPGQATTVAADPQLPIDGLRRRFRAAVERCKGWSLT